MSGQDEEPDDAMLTSEKFQSVPVVFPADEGPRIIVGREHFIILFFPTLTAGSSFNKSALGEPVVALLSRT